MTKTEQRRPSESPYNGEELEHGYLLGDVYAPKPSTYFLLALSEMYDLSQEKGVPITTDFMGYSATIDARTNPNKEEAVELAKAVWDRKSKKS